MDLVPLACKDVDTATFHMPTTFANRAKCSGTVGRALDWGSKDYLVRDSPDSVCCVLEQDKYSVRHKLSIASIVS